MAPVRFGLSLHPFERFGSIEALIETAARADDLGFDTIVLGEHAVVPLGMARDLGRMWFDPLALAGALAQRTRRARLLLFLALPHHHPILLAKAAATIDQLCGGRLILGIGLGSVREEAAFLGVPWRERAARTDDALLAMKALWASSTPAFEGDYTRFAGMAFEPLPAQQPHPPVWVGGSGKRARERAIGLGDGYYPTGIASDEALAAEAAALQAALAAAGRDGEPFVFAQPVQFGIRVHGDDAPRKPFQFDGDGGRDALCAHVVTASVMGVTDMIVRMPSGDLPELRGAMERFARAAIQTPR